MTIFRSHSIGACLIVGTLAIAAVVQAGGARAGTDWDALSGDAWGGKQAGGSGKVAEASGGGMGAEIKKAFVKLGMADARAECYGSVLVEKLSPEGQEKAVKLVQGASDAEDVKTGVITSGPEMVGGFSAADASCPESMLSRRSRTLPARGGLAG